MSVVVWSLNKNGGYVGLGHVPLCEDMSEMTLFSFAQASRYLVSSLPALTCSLRVS